MSIADPIFDLRGVSYSYGRHPALHGIDLRVERGARIALLGSNGSGKSTLLRLLDGLFAPTGGQIAFDGTELDEHILTHEEFVLDFRRRVALLFQDPDVQLFNATVFDEVAFGPLQLRWPKEEVRQKVDAVLERMEIAPLRDRAPHRLSGGEKKRIALASILVLDPEVLLLDEPTSALDPRSQSQLVDFLTHIDRSKTVITATHDLDTVEDIADVCFVLRGGKIVATGPPEKILADRELLLSVNLIHEFHHKHSHGEPHYHPHLHNPDGAPST